VRLIALNSEAEGNPLADITAAQRKSMANKGKSFFINGNYSTKISKNRSNEHFF
jgi:hypothetical protein